MYIVYKSVDDFVNNVLLLFPFKVNVIYKSIDDFTNVYSFSLSDDFLNLWMYVCMYKIKKSVFLHWIDNFILYNKKYFVWWRNII